MKKITFFFLLISALAACKPSANTPPNQEKASGPAPDSVAQQILNLTDQIKKDPTNYGLYHDRALLWYESDSLDRAVQDVDMALSLYKNSPELHHLRGFFAMAENDTALAETEYLAAAGLGSRDPETYYQLGQVFFFRKNYPEAEKWYGSAIKINDQDPQYPFAIGLVREVTAKYPAAIRQYETALKLDSAFAKAYDRLYDLYQNRLNQPEKAAKWLETWLAFAPGHPMARFYEGEKFRNEALQVPEKNETAFKEALNKAVASYSIAINVDPNFAQALFYRAECFALAENYESAIQDYSKIPAAHPFFAAAQFQLGAIAEYFQDYSGALKHYRSAAAANPDSKDAQRAVKEMEARLQAGN